MSKYVLITGASRGIGRETAKLFAENGYTLIIHYHQSQKNAELLRTKLSTQKCDSFVVNADVSSKENVAAMYEEIKNAGLSVDILINNAGISQQKLFTDITTKDWDRMFDVNVKGIYHCCKYFLPDMIRKRQGAIVNVSSIWGISGASCEVHYSAAKAAVIGFTKALAKEVGPSNIRVNCVAPGVIDTDMNCNLDEKTLSELIKETPLQSIGTARDVAQAIFFLASEQSKFITGQVLSPNGGFVI